MILPNGIYNLDDLKSFGGNADVCPYYIARRSLMMADVIIFNYQYMLDPRISGMVSKELEGDSIVVFDEAHNIDNICIEAYSVRINKTSLFAGISLF